jgi:hypothetical protein
MKKKLERRIGSLESLRAKMQAKYGAEDHLVLELDREIAAVREGHARLKTAKVKAVAGRHSHASHTPHL